MKIFKIGYQGIEGSWAEEATRIFIKKLGLHILSTHNKLMLSLLI